MKRRKIQIDTSSKKGKIEMGVVQKGRSSLPFSFSPQNHTPPFISKPTPIYIMPFYFNLSTEYPEYTTQKNSNVNDTFCPFFNTEKCLG